MLMIIMKGLQRYTISNTNWSITIRHQCVFNGNSTRTSITTLASCLVLQFLMSKQRLSTWMPEARPILSSFPQNLLSWSSKSAMRQKWIICLIAIRYTELKGYTQSQSYWHDCCRLEMDGQIKASEKTKRKSGSLLNFP